MNHGSHRTSTSFLAALLLTLGGLAGCAGEEATEDAYSADEAAEEAVIEAEDSSPRVFFTNVEDGDEVTSPVLLTFGVENFTIVPATDPPEVQEGMGHHHLGINTHCLPSGEVIEKADPWIHFGDGSATIDVQLPPGPAHLALQIGDGEHRTLADEGLCAMIDLTVIEEGV